MAKTSTYLIYDGFSYSHLFMIFSWFEDVPGNKNNCKKMKPIWVYFWIMSDLFWFFLMILKFRENPSFRRFFGTKKRKKRNSNTFFNFLSEISKQHGQNPPFPAYKYQWNSEENLILKKERIKNNKKNIFAGSTQLVSRFLPGKRKQNQETYSIFFDLLFIFFRKQPWQAPNPPFLLNTQVGIDAVFLHKKKHVEIDTKTKFQRLLRMYFIKPWLTGIILT